MTLQTIDIPESISTIPLSDRATRLIDDANDRIEAFMLADQSVNENFVTCDFDLLDQSLAWIQQNQSPAPNRFCELGSGFGVATMLAAIRGMESIGIEIDSALVAQSREFANEFHIPAQFVCGSFVPRDAVGLLDLAPELEHVESDDGDAYQEIGLAITDINLFFTYPWPHENPFIEAMFDACAADGALLLTYRGRQGMNLIRKFRE